MCREYLVGKKNIGTFGLKYSRIMEWDGDRVNDYFIKLFNHANIYYAENKRPRSEFFNSMRIIDHAYKDFYYECACYAWTREKLLGVFERFMQVKELDKDFDYSDYESDFKRSEKYINLQNNLAIKYKKIAENYLFKFDDPIIQHLSKD